MDPTPDQGGPAIDGALGKPAMARTLAYLFLASASLALAGLAVPHGGELSVPGMLAVIGAGAALGGGLLARAPRPRRGWSGERPPRASSPPRSPRCSWPPQPPRRPRSGSTATLTVPTRSS